jgi:hypothetical protein
MSFEVRGYASPAWRNHRKVISTARSPDSPLRSDSMYRTPVEIGSFLPPPVLLESAHCLSISFHFSCTTYPSPSASPSKRVSSSQNPLHQKKHRHPPTHNSDTNSAAVSNDWLPHASRYHLPSAPAALLLASPSDSVSCPARSSGR